MIEVVAIYIQIKYVSMELKKEIKKKMSLNEKIEYHNKI